MLSGRKRIGRVGSVVVGVALLVGCSAGGGASSADDATTAGAPRTTTTDAATTTTEIPEDMVVIRLPGLQPEDAWDLEDDLDAAATDAGVGSMDGDGYDMEGDFLEIFFYGPDADALLDALLPVLDGNVPEGSVAFKASGPVGTPEVEVPLS